MKQNNSHFKPYIIQLAIFSDSMVCVHRKEDVLSGIYIISSREWSASPSLVAEVQVVVCISYYLEYQQTR